MRWPTSPHAAGRVRLALAALVLGGLTAGCGLFASGTPASTHRPIRLVDDLHQVVTLPRPAKRLVVLEPSNFELVAALGLTNRIVGVDASVPEYVPPPWSKAARRMPSIGSVLSGVPTEKIVADRPSLVIASEGIAGLSSLTALHIPVLVLEPETVAGVYHDLLLVGRATGQVARATRVVRTMKRQIAALESQVARVKDRPTTFYDLGGLYTGGRNSFLGDLLDMAGAVNTAADMSTKMWPEVNAEQVVKANPAVILIDQGTATPAEEAKLPGFSHIAATKTHHILVVPQPSYVEEPSPALVMGLRELINLLHPGLLHSSR